MSGQFLSIWMPPFRFLWLIILQDTKRLELFPRKISTGGKYGNFFLKKNSHLFRYVRVIPIFTPVYLKSIIFYYTSINNSIDRPFLYLSIIALIDAILNHVYVY